MHFLELFFIAVSLAMDAFAVSVSSGITIRKLKVWHAVKIGLFFGVFQAIMPTIGYYLGQFFARYVESVSSWVAFILLTFIGMRMVHEAIKSKGEEKPATNDPLNSKVLLVLAVATSIDALAVGIGFAFLPGVNIAISAATIGLVAFVISVFGTFLGKKAGDILGNKAEIAGGLILILIGVKILIQHLLGI